MNYMSIKEASALWGVSQQMIRRYCREGRITGAIQKDGSWAVPINANKPGQPAVIAPPKELKDFAKHVVYQHEKNYHFGIYEYIQVNLAYSSNRMASNRLTRVQVMEAYRTNRVSVAFEPMKIDDVIETINHFLCMRYVIDNLATPLNAAFLKKLHYILFYGTYSDRRDKNRVGAFRTEPGKMGIPAGNIVKELPTLVNLYDVIEVELHEKYVEYKKELGTAIPRFGGVRGIDNKDDASSFFLKNPMQYTISSGYLYPIFGAFRALLSYDEEEHKLNWMFDPVTIWKEVGKSLTQNTFESSANPQLAGKDKQLWLSNYRIVETQSLRKLLKRRG